jgi:hypothetical protein
MIKVLYMHVRMCHDETPYDVQFNMRHIKRHEKS